jgi:hypothetical protein
MASTTEPSDMLRAPVAMADRAIDWLSANLDRFEPFRGRFERDWPTHRALVELALIGMCLRRQTIFADDARVARLLERVLQTYRHPVYREIAFRHGGDFVADAFVPVALYACGLLDGDDERRALQSLIDNGNILLRSRAPHKTLELIHVLELGGFRYRLPSAVACLQRFGSKPMNLIEMTNDDAYVITHTIFYLSDFGARLDFAIPVKQRRDLSWVVHHLLGMCVREGHWDLVGELLLCCHSLRLTGSPLYTVGWRAFLTAQRPDGAVPGPHYDPAQLNALAASDRREYLFQSCYHTTLVAALAGAQCQADGAVDDELG